MKALKGLVIILITTTTFLLACVNQQSKTNESNNKMDVIEDSIKNPLIIAYLDKKVKEPVFTSDDFLNKTFYRFHKTDSGQFVVDWYYSGLGGIRFTQHTWEGFGFEQYVSIIDAIEVHSGYCTVYLKENHDSKKSYQFRIEPVSGKPGHILINEVSMLVDSTMLHTVKFVKEEPYDIEEVWRNDPANQ